MPLEHCPTVRWTLQLEERSALQRGRIREKRERLLGPAFRISGANFWGKVKWCGKFGSTMRSILSVCHRVGDKTVIFPNYLSPATLQSFAGFSGKKMLLPAHSANPDLLTGSRTRSTFPLKLCSWETVSAQ